MFTPKHILYRDRKKRLALFLLLIATPLVIFNLTASVGASTIINYDFEEGSFADTALEDSVVTLVRPEVKESSRIDFLMGDERVSSLSPTHLPSSGGIELEKAYIYTASTTPGFLPNVSISRIFREDNLLYVSTNGGGLYVINTQNTLDPGDDVLVAQYFTGSTPALNSNNVRSVFKDGNVLYISTGSGLSVINTQGTLDQGDDVLVVRYSTATTPAVANNSVFDTFKDGNVVYASTNGGLSVINTQGTLTASDDVLVVRYHTGSAPALASNSINNTFLDNNLLYISTTGGGLSVINTQGTLDPGDDVLVTRYFIGSTPALMSDTITRAFIDNGALYISTTAEGLHVINTQGTLDPADDVLVTRYFIGSTPSIGTFNRNAFLDNDLLYINTASGVWVVDTKGTLDSGDDVLVFRYDTASIPALNNNSTFHSFLYENTLYIGTAGSNLHVINIDGYVQPGTYRGKPRRIDAVPTKEIAVSADTEAGQDVELSYRTSAEEVSWLDEFEDGAVSSYDPDPFAWNTAVFQDVTEVNGVLRLSNPNPQVSGSDRSVYFWIDPEKAENYFPADSLVTARIRINSNRTRSSSDLMLAGFGGGATSFINNEWQVLRQRTTSSFNLISFQLNWSNDSWNNETDFVEIDSVQITPPDSFAAWNPWVTCPSFVLCALENLESNTWIQYKLDLVSTDLTNTQRVTEVAFRGDYESYGIYTSNTTTFRKPHLINTFTPTATIPASTTVAYEYSVDNGTSWIPFDESLPLNVRTESFTWRAIFTSNNPSVTPELTGATLSYTELPSQGTATTLQGRINRLTTTDPEKAAAIKDTYPHLLDSPLTEDEINTRIVDLLEEIITILTTWVNKIHRD